MEDVMQAYAKLFVATSLCTALGAVAGYSFHAVPLQDTPMCNVSPLAGNTQLSADPEWAATWSDGAAEASSSWKRWPTTTDF